MGTSSVELLVPLDRSKPRGLRTQIEDELRCSIREGRLAPGTALPSTRALAGDLGVTRGVVVDAYDQLIAEGYLVARPGAGTVVNDASPQAAAPAPRATAGAPALEVDFRPGLPELELFPRAAWLKATRAALQTMPDASLAYGHPTGLPVLQRSLTDYLARVRGVAAAPEQVVVVAGFGHGLAMVATALRAAGHDAVAVEDPGYDGTREVLGAVGLDGRGVSVDDEGLVVDELRRTGARAVVVTPAHQSPLGMVLSPDRRRQLLDWAADVDGLVLEDDYDAEYRYDRRPVGALQGLAPERVVYFGTTSKSLAPGVRLGWLVVPPDLVAPIVAQRKVTDGATSALLQATYAAFLDAGDLDRHLRRARRLYRQRRDALIDALARRLPDAVPGGISAGLGLVVALPHGIDEHRLEARARAAGVGVYPLASYRVRPRPAGTPPMVVLGYGSLTPARADRGVELLAGVIDELR